MMSKKHTQCFGLLNYNTNLAFTSLKWLCFSGTLQVLAVVLVNSSQPLHPAKVWDHHRALRLPVTSLHLINFEKKGQAPASWKKEDSAKEKHIIYTYIYIYMYIYQCISYINYIMYFYLHPISSNFYTYTYIDLLIYNYCYYHHYHIDLL